MRAAGSVAVRRATARPNLGPLGSAQSIGTARVAHRNAGSFGISWHGPQSSPAARAVSAAGPATLDSTIVVTVSAMMSCLRTPFSFRWRAGATCSLTHLGRVILLPTAVAENID